MGADPVAPVFPSVWSAREEVSATTTPQRIAQQVYFDGPNNRELALTNQSMYDTMITVRVCRAAARLRRSRTEVSRPSAVRPTICVVAD